MRKLLIPPTSYQGGKQRISKSIVDILLKENDISSESKFIDLCCGSGSISLELINRGISPENIVMVDMGIYGKFWESIAKGSFNLTIFKNELEKLPDVENIQNYLKSISKELVNEDLIVYHYLLLQAGSFGSKQIWVENNAWKNASFRNYWKPTETSNRKSPVNPMMPMPNNLLIRVENIVNELSNKINAINVDINNLGYNINKNDIIYIDPPYINTTGYGFSLNYEEIIEKYKNNKIYISEGIPLNNMKSVLISSGRLKGNINGKSNKQPNEEWLNILN